MREIVTVTEDDIHEANMRQGADGYDPFRECPIGQATERQHPDWDFLVFSNNLMIFGDGCREVMLPEAAVEFVDRFDHEQPVQPFEFEIEVD